MSRRSGGSCGPGGSVASSPPPPVRGACVAEHELLTGAPARTFEMPPMGLMSAALQSYLVR
jgi:hypothetical protein